MRILVDETPKRRWKALTDAARAPLQQRWTYGDAIKAVGGTCLRFEICDRRKTLAIAQAVQRRVGVSVTLISLGPVWVDSGDPDKRAAALKMLLQHVPGLVLTTPLTDCGACPSSRMTRVMTPATSALLDLGPGIRERQSGKWRNRLRAAEKSELKVRSKRPTREELVELLLTDEDQRRAKGFRGLPSTFTLAWNQLNRDALLTTAKLKEETVASMLFLRHGTTATYHIGWSSETGRAHSAHNLTLWYGSETLAKAGVQTLDLGLIDTENAPGLARFKLGTGAKPIRTGGTWLGW